MHLWGAGTEGNSASEAAQEPRVQTQFSSKPEAVSDLPADSQAASMSPIQGGWAPASCHRQACQALSRPGLAQWHLPLLPPMIKQHPSFHAIYPLTGASRPALETDIPTALTVARPVNPHAAFSQESKPAPGGTAIGHEEFCRGPGQSFASRAGAFSAMATCLLGPTSLETPP